MIATNKTPTGAVNYSAGVGKKLIAFLLTATVTAIGMSSAFIFVSVLAVLMDYIFGWVVAGMISMVSSTTTTTASTFAWGMFVSNMATAIATAFSLALPTDAVRGRLIISVVALILLSILDMLCAYLVDYATPGEMPTWSQWYAGGGVLSDIFMSFFIIILDPLGVIKKVFEDENPYD